MNSYYLKTQRVFTPLRKYAWLFIPLTAIGGLWYPRLGLLIIPVMVFLAVLGMLKGKYWCGNYCPHGSLFDQYLSVISFNRPIPRLLRSKLIRAIAFTWFGIMLVLRLARVFQLWGDMVFWDRLGYIFVMNYLVVTIAGTILAFAVSPRAWCSFCPMGTLQKLTYALGRFSGFNRQIDQNVTVASPSLCHSCATCARVCPMQLEPFKNFNEDNQFASPDCIRCSTCVQYCPAGILSLSNREQAAKIVASVDATGYQNRQLIKARVAETRELNPGTREFVFDLVEPTAIKYQPGQFVLVRVEEQPEVWRAYSLSSLNPAGDRLQITVRNNPGGFGTPRLFNLQPGEQVLLEGPLGNELVVDKGAEKIVLVAGGIGITPFVPLAQELVEGKNSAREITLIYGVNKEEEFIYQEHFLRLARCSDRFRFVPVVACPDQWQGEKGFVIDVLAKMDLSGAKLYLCGPKPMIGAVFKVLETAPVGKGQVFYESA